MNDMSLGNGLYDIPPGKIAAVVTYLQMHEKPAFRSTRQEAAWQIVKVERPDIGWYRSLYRRVGEEWLWFSRLLLSDAELNRILEDPGIDFYVFQAEGLDEGIIELDFRSPGECELAFFGLSPAMLGRGAGRWLMNEALTLSWSRPISRLWLHTCTYDHPQAVNFYRRSGFIAYRRQIEVADDPRLTGKAARDAAAHIPII